MFGQKIRGLKFLAGILRGLNLFLDFDLKPSKIYTFLESYISSLTS